MLKILGGIFKILWIIVKGCFNGLLNILKYYYLAVIGTCKILGISAIPNHLVASLLAIFVYVAYYVAMVIVPELIIYNTGKLTKKYKKLKTEEEKKEYLSKRALPNDEKPFLVDFSSVPPKEVITGNECNNIILSKNIKGKKIEILLENPELLNNPELYENLTQDELKNLKALLMQDINYQTNLKKFFAMNKKALEYKKI